MSIGSNFLRSARRTTGTGLSREEVRRLYHLILGRQPESDAVLEDQSGSALGTTVSNFLASAEFETLAKIAIAGGGLPHARHLSAQDYRETAAWLSRVIDQPPPSMEPSWWLLIQTLLDSNLVETDSPTVNRLLDRARQEAVGHIERYRPLEALFAFNPAWFARRYKHSALAVQTGAYANFEEYFLSEGLERRLQIMPAFSDGLGPLYSRLETFPGLTFETVATATFDSARAGELSHWLFDAEYYQQSAEWKTGFKSRGNGISDPPYLEFLLHGDHEQIPPHPLFCHETYRSLNTSGDDEKFLTFAHFVQFGLFEGKRTSMIFDEGYYLSFNPSVKREMLEKSYVSPLHHFVAEGIYKNLAFSPDFDVDFYAAANPDVMQAVENGEIASAAFHFVFAGLAEGRAPNPYFDPDYYVLRQPTAPAEMREKGIRSTLEHFLLIGKARGYKATPPLIDQVPSLSAAKAIFKRRAQRSVNNLLKNPLDFTELVSTDPEISIVVPVFNEGDFTARLIECLHAAAMQFAFYGRGKCEIIFVDNGSTDFTPELLKSCKGLRVVRFDGPIGFPRAVNAGIEASRGKIVIVSNNDVEVGADVLVQMHRRLSEDATIGVLGGIVVLPNETIQEAGSYVDQVGNVVGLGREDNPWDAYFQGLREADYCSGCFIAFRRDDHDAVGGLDEAFSPGYYEETDFTFRMREQLGKRAIVDSEIQVVHFEHASFGKGRPPTTAYAIIKRNQRLFVSKHQQALSAQPQTDQLVVLNGPLPGAIGRSRYLVIEDMIPDARLGSGFVRTAQLLAGLSERGVAFDLLALNPHSLLDDYADPRVRVFRGWMPEETPQDIFAHSMARYSHVIVCRTHNLSRFGKMLEEARRKHGFAVLCDTEALSSLRLLEMDALAGSTPTDEERVEAVADELETAVKVSRWIAVSPNEAAMIEKAGLRPTTTLCQRVRLPALPEIVWEQKTRILSLGAIHEAGSPNHDAIIWFMDKIRPKCLDAFAKHRLTIAGFWKPDVAEAFLKRYADCDFDFLGTVSEQRLATLYGEAKLTLAPTRFAAGVAIKAVESMALGIPIVVTDLLEKQIVPAGKLGDAGLAVGSREDDGKSFAQWVSKLSADKAAWDRVRSSQLEVVRPFGTDEAFAAGLDEILEVTATNN